MSTQDDQPPLEKIKRKARQVERAGREPAPVRHYRSILFQGLLIAIASTFAVLVVLVKTTPSFAIDLTITRAIQSIDLAFFPALMSMISWPGFSPQAMIIAGLIVLLIFALGLRWEALAAGVAALLPTLVNVVVKDLIQRPRPTPALVKVVDALNSYSFPSGHVMFYLGFFGFLSYLVFTQSKPSLRRTLILIVLNFLILTIGISRIYLGEHWASDVAGAYLLGSLTLIALVRFFLWGKERFFLRQTAGAPQVSLKTNDPPSRKRRTKHVKEE